IAFSTKIKAAPEEQPVHLLFLLSEFTLFLVRLVGNDLQSLLISQLFGFLILGDFEVVFAFFDIRSPTTIKDLYFRILFKGFNMLFSVGFSLLNDKLYSFFFIYSQRIIVFA